jgi:hypothetical protein
MPIYRRAEENLTFEHLLLGNPKKKKPEPSGCRKRLLRALGLLVLICILASAAACASGGPRNSGVVPALTYLATIEGMKAAAEGAPGTMMLSDGNLLVFIWEQGNKLAFSVVRLNSASAIEEFTLQGGGEATRLNIFSMADLVEHLESIGYQRFYPRDLPKWITAAMETQATWFNAIGLKAMPTILLVPVNELDPLPTLYPRIDS